MQSLLITTILDKPTRRLREKEEADSKDDGPKPLDGDGKTVGKRGVVIVSSLVDTGGEKKTLMKVLEKAIWRLEIAVLTMVIAH